MNVSPLQFLHLGATTSLRPRFAFTSNDSWKDQRARIKQLHQICSKIKIILTVFIDFRGVVYYELLLMYYVVNKNYYLNVLCCLHETVCQKWPEIWRENSCVLHHDSVSLCSVVIINEFLIKHSTNITSQTLYSWCDPVWLFLISIIEIIFL